MKAIFVEIDGIINLKTAQDAGASAASLKALEERGVEVTADSFAEKVSEMSLAHADNAFESAMWHFYRPVLNSKGYDRKQQLRHWRELLRARRAHLPYRFRERQGIRELLEEIKFGSVDSWGDVPKLVAVGRDGEFAKNSLEVDGLSPLFEMVAPCEDYGLGRGDTRYLSSVLAQIGVEASHSILLSNSLRPLAASAARIGMDTLVMLEGSAAMGFEAARTPNEEPSFVVSSFDDLCEGVIDWINAPVLRQSSGRLPAAAPLAQSLEREGE